MDTFYTPEEIANQLKVHLQTVLNYIKDGRLEALKLDKGYRVSESAFKKFVYGSRVARTPEEYLSKLISQKKYSAYRKTSIKPLTPLDKPILNQDLEGLLRSASIENIHGHRAFPFPTLSLQASNQQRLPDGILFENEVTFVGNIFFFAFASIRGEILAAESLWEDTGLEDFRNSIGLLTSIGIIYRGLLFIPKYYSSIKYEGDVNYAFVIDKPAGKTLSMDSGKGGRSWRDNYYTATSEDPIIIEENISSSITPEQIKEKAIKMTKSLLWYFRCELTDEVIESLIKEVTEGINS